MKVVIEHAEAAARGLWLADVRAEQLLRLSTSPLQIGRRHVVLVSGAFFKEESSQLEFDLGAATVLNLGKGTEAIFVDADLSSASVSSLMKTANRAFGDSAFRDALDKLPVELCAVGTLLLTEVRKHFVGELKFYPASKKFVETPDNFWVVRIQPRDGSLRVVVYGTPHQHGNYKSIRLVADMGSYSAFKVSSRDQIEDAVTAIRGAHALKRG
jgi:hypothetical protein